MTLIVSEVSRFGIAMAADSAITETYPEDWILPSGSHTPPTVRVGAQKIIPIRTIDAAISVWGFGAVGAPGQEDVMIPIDRYLEDFAEMVKPNSSLEEVGNQLAAVTNERIEVGQVRGGFHLGGYTTQGAKRFPALYHIHTGHKPGGPHRPLELRPDYPFDSGRDVDRWLKELKSTTFWLRNGAIDAYGAFQRHLNDLMNRLRKEADFDCPYYPRFSSALEARGRFLRLQIQTICEFYRLSNRLETIAMPISWITISEKGIEHFEPVVI